MHWAFKKIHLNTSIKHHALLGTFLGIWLVVFLILISPFDTAELRFYQKIHILPPYAILIFLAYMLTVFIQNRVFKILNKWNRAYELIFHIVLVIMILIFIYPYYKGDLVRGDFGFWEFVVGIYLPISLVFVALIFIGRLYLNKMVKDRSKIIIKGKSKGEILQIDPSDIIAISSAQNYIDVHYLQGGAVRKTILRKTLSEIQSELPNLKQVHRSHLVNFEHFEKWSDSNSIVVQGEIIPVSKKYKDLITELY